MFGSYTFPLKIKEGNLTISVEKAKDVFIYKRKIDDDIAEKVLLSGKSRLLINPIEPLNLPQEITSCLMIQFARPILVGPKTSKIIYVKFPVEIGVFIASDDRNEILDLFSLARQKFTLYGNPKSGIICRHYASDVYPDRIEVDLLREGLLEILVKNNTDRWIELTKSVLSAYGMKIYFNGEKSAMKAVMKMDDRMHAETDFVDSPLEKGMKKSIELFSQKKIPLSSVKFVMREGL